MFVNITRGNHTSILECREASYFPHKHKAEVIVVRVERMDGTTVTYELTRLGSDMIGVFLMNDTGKTIATLWRRSAAAG